MITAALVKELRETTGVGMMECKNALKETEGDIEGAIKLLRERGQAKAVKKADRDANDGVISAKIDEAGKTGTLIELNCETDFVAKNENFQAFVAEVLDTLTAAGADSPEAAAALPKGDGTLDEFVKTKVLEMGENLQLRRVTRFEVAG
ncbi:translation elongation factor Ts, partial [Akkermansiaceae bacterium]|nr:translation elongation factor Ts [Akkermansiaceae bacterium]